ncbi:dTDP-4-dehydrorhamnose reductase [Vibrio furnissii]|uniref:dTDP-4-dehydrorhamnose reductase n=1 Tax=Vibrio furnissii TaxID=29494 RepID=UPI00205B063C|nr:dTDP-4-dehydrorhamnose reductase [Vibrio furnissii]UPO64807.1 dTDP-6-deoxy-L-mannose dehydrogenase [Vibrio fluvialis]WHR50793.1 dTDP-4-dehydrorhamnose reductase [Vibrio furnissii]
MRILITGSQGQVGFCLVEQLNKANDVEFLALDKTGLDITDESAVSDVIENFQPDVVINAAAYTAVDKAEQESELCYAINHDGPLNLARATQKVGAAILHISTDYVFSGDKDGLYREDETTAPQGVYGLSKLAGEKAVAEACPRHIILRTAWVFGEQGNNFVKTMLRLAQTRDSLGVVSDQIGGPTYAGDIATALIKISRVVAISEKQNVYGIYHFSGLPHVSWCEFAENIFSKAVEQGVLEKGPIINAITTRDYPTPAKRPANSRLDTDRITNTFGIEACDWQAALSSLSAYRS